MSAEDYCQEPGPAESLWGEHAKPRSSELSAQNSCKEARCQRVTYCSQSLEHFIRCIRFVFMSYEVEVGGQLQWSGMPWSGPAIAGSQISCKLKPNLSFLEVAVTHLIGSAHVIPI